MAAASPGRGPAASVADLTALIAAARAKATLYQTGIPPEWVNYQAIFDLWKQDYGVTIDGTADGRRVQLRSELDLIKNTGKPDVGDVGISFAVQAKDGRPSPPV